MIPETKIALPRRLVSAIDEPMRDIEDRLASLFQPDTLLAAHYFELLRTKNLEPEKKLMLAVLEDAVACFLRYVTARDSRRKAIFQEVEKWIRKEDIDWLFSFENVCEALDLNPNYVRRGLFSWKHQELTRACEVKTSISRQKPGRILYYKQQGNG